jgi:DNA-binding transcriptional regulator GbsR (MarR family)
MEIDFYDSQNLSKEEYINYKYFVMSLCFKGRTACTDQSLLIALIGQHIRYTNGKSGVRPGVRKMRTETALNKNTVARSLERLKAQGWIEKIYSGNREGSATIWRVNFSNPPYQFKLDFDYKELINPLAQFEVIWTKYCLGPRALFTFNALHLASSDSPQGLICSKIMNATGSSRRAINDTLQALINFNLVYKNGRFYGINPDVYIRPEKFYEEIFDYYSVDYQKELRINLHNLESRHTAVYRSKARQTAVQKIISSNLQKDSDNKSEHFNYNENSTQLEG